MSLSSEDLKLMETIAIEVEKRQMSAPVIMFLEMHRPLSFVTSSFLLTLGPLLSIFFTIPNFQRVVELMEQRENVGLLLDLIEKAAKGQLLAVDASESESCQ